MTDFESGELPLGTTDTIEYCDAWSHNSSFYQEQGCYEWIASQLTPLRPKRVLDIGCGTGHGLQSLLDSFSPQIVSVDENYRCIEKAHEHLVKAGWRAEANFRLMYILHPDGTHQLINDDEPIVAGKDVTLVHADVLREDDVFQNFLHGQAPFDLLTIWLVGTYKRSATCRELWRFNMSNADDYRLLVERRAVELGAPLLKGGGWVQIVIRGEVLDSRSKQRELFGGYQIMLSNHGCEVASVASRSYTERTDKGVCMTATLHGKDVSLEGLPLAMYSILGRKH